MEGFNGALESGVGAFSYQSLVPAGAGAPRYEDWVHWLIEGFRCRLGPPPLT